MDVLIPMINSVSYSKLVDFEQCPRRAKMKHIDKVAEEKAPAAERGTEIHQKAEDFVRGLIQDIPPELLKFETEFNILQREFPKGNISLEGEWGFDKDWHPTEYKSAWLRMKADGVFFKTVKHAVVIDYKTGRSWGNELKHSEQVLLYAIATFINYPYLDEIEVELWYLDQNEILAKTYTREQALRMLQMFERRMKKVTSATEFPANPTVITCKYCPFGPNKGGQCEEGVAEGYDPIKLYRQKFG